MSYPFADTVGAERFELPPTRRRPDRISFIAAAAAQEEQRSRIELESAQLEMQRIAVASHHKGYQQGHLAGSMQRARFVFLVGLLSGCTLMAAALALGRFIGG